MATPFTIPVTAAQVGSYSHSTRLCCSLCLKFHVFLGALCGCLGWDLLCGAVLSSASAAAGLCAPILLRIQHDASH